jgi:TonB family protein
MRRTWLLLLLLLHSTSLHAQGIFAGMLMDPKLKTPLPCVEVALEDSAAHEVAHARTAADGAFQFDSPRAGSYRPRFDAWHHAPVYGAFETLDPTTDRARVYEIAFGAARKGGVKYWPDTTDSPPGKPLNLDKVQIRYPWTMRKVGYAGTVRMRYVVDSVGWVVRPTLQVLESPIRDFTEEALRYLRNAQFEPARRGGRPVCALMVDQPISFELEGPGAAHPVVIHSPSAAADSAAHQ